MEWCVCLDIYFFYLFLVEEVVYVVVVEGGGNCLVDIRQCYVYCFSFCSVDVYFEYWCIFQVVWVYFGDLIW